MVFILGLHASWDKCEKAFLLFLQLSSKRHVKFLFSYYLP